MSCRVKSYLLCGVPFHTPEQLHCGHLAKPPGLPQNDYGPGRSRRTGGFAPTTGCENGQGTKTSVKGTLSEVARPALLYAPAEVSFYVRNRKAILNLLEAGDSSSFWRCIVSKRLSRFVSVLRATLTCTKVRKRLKRRRKRPKRQRRGISPTPNPGPTDRRVRQRTGYENDSIECQNCAKRQSAILAQVIGCSQ